MKNIIYTIMLGVAITISSCSDFLDVVPDDVPRIENAFSLKAQAEKYLFTCYSYMPKHASVSQNPAFLGGDEIWISSKWRDRQGLNTWRIACGEQKTDNPYCDFWSSNLYQGISDCNIFLENIASVPDMDNNEKEWWTAEVQFLKAYYHYWLIRCYGPIVVKDKNVSINAPTEELHAPRQTIDSCFNYVVNLFDQVIANPNLPNKIASDDPIALGRISKAIAYSIKAEALIFAASDLYNGGYQKVLSQDSIDIFCTNKSYEAKLDRWKQAEAAIKEAIDFVTDPSIDFAYSLYSLNDPLYNSLPDEIKLKLTIRDAPTLAGGFNTEVIWANVNSRVGSGGQYSTDLDLQGFPRGLETDKHTPYSGNHGVNLKVAAEFYTKNGLPIDQDQTWNFDKRFEVAKIDSKHQYYMKEGDTTALFNFDREPRYYASLGFDRCIYTGFGNLFPNTLNSEGGQVPPLYVQARPGERCANLVETSTNVTGIWPKKMLNFRASLSSSSWTSTRYPWPVMRLANLYLMYAEALNEANNSQDARDKAIEYLDMVRVRAGIPGVKEAWDKYSRTPGKYASQVGLRSIIRRERLIEMAFEGSRFWDLRRWKESQNYLNAPITGWNISGERVEDYYKERQIYIQSFTLKDYFWPINNYELFSNPNMVQNYGWN